MASSPMDWRGLASRLRVDGQEAMPVYASTGKVSPPLLVELDAAIERQKAFETTPHVSAYIAAQTMVDMLAFHAYVRKRLGYEKGDRKRLALIRQLPALKEAEEESERAKARRRAAAKKEAAGG